MIATNTADVVAPEEGEARLQRRLLKHGSWTLAANAVMLSANVLTGVLIARGLGATGRGQFTAITVPPLLIGWAFAMGCSAATSYHQARHPEDGGALIATWLVLLAPLALVAVVAGHYILRIVLAAQTPATVRLADLYLYTIFCGLLAELIFGVLLGDQDFMFFNAVRAIQPTATALLYLALWATGKFSLETALIGLVVPLLVGLGLATRRALRRHGLSSPSPHLARTTLWYGIRAHGTKVSDILNLRLDLLMLPAFLAAASVGVYAVATTVSGVVVTLSGALSFLVLPIVAREGALAVQTVVRLARATLLLAVIVGLGMGLLASIGIRLVYGNAFEASVLVVWLLLPGTVLYSCSDILRQALYGVNRPLTAAATYGLGTLVTVPGLLIFLRHGGLIAAALVSTVSYATVFAASLLAYTRVAHVKIRAFVPTFADVSPLIAVLHRLLSRSGRRRLAQDA
jgi:O-antigen/teichoic acid export membrane protein